MCFFRNRLFYYKIVMAAHLLAATSLLAVRINKCQHLVVDKNAIICIESCLYTFIIPFNIHFVHWISNTPPPLFSKKKNNTKNTYLPNFKIPCNRKHTYSFFFGLGSAHYKVYVRCHGGQETIFEYEIDREGRNRYCNTCFVSPLLEIVGNKKLWTH